MGEVGWGERQLLDCVPGVGVWWGAGRGAHVRVRVRTTPAKHTHGPFQHKWACVQRGRLPHHACDVAEHPAAGRSHVETDAHRQPKMSATCHMRRQKVQRLARHPYSREVWRDSIVVISLVIVVGQLGCGSYASYFCTILYKYADETK